MWRLTVAKARRDRSKDVAGGGRMCAPLVVFGPPRPARAKTPAEATETLTEDTNFVRRPTKKHVRAVWTPTYTYAPPPGQILATCLARSTMECVVRNIRKTRSRHPSWVATPGGGEDRYPRVLDFSSSPSSRAVAPPPLIPIPVVNGGLQRFRSFFG